jgi:mannose-6-phosphate isomerase-like protein (cupin superfamily)
MQRRNFIRTSLLALPAVASAQDTKPGNPGPDHGILVPAGTDRMEEKHTLGFSTIAFKVASADTRNGLFLMEHDNLGKGGPYRHVHPEQDEWLYALAGEFHVEIGDQKSVLRPGDSILMPRTLPHVWAQVSDTPGKLLIGFTPAGRMEDFFRDFGKTGKLPTDPTVVGPYGLHRVGPPLAI